jgi:hypothetical protein
MIVGGQACWEERQTMDVQEILQQLTTQTGTFPLEAVAQAIAQREAITPELLRVLAEAQHNIEHLIESDSMAHIYAMYLLAQFREPRAYPLIVEFFSIPGDIAKVRMRAVPSVFHAAVEGLLFWQEVYTLSIS